jgi:hypothetical protein
MKYLHPISMYTLLCGGVQRGVTPSTGSRGKWALGEGSGAASPDGGSWEKPLKEKIAL